MPIWVLMPTPTLRADEPPTERIVLHRLATRGQSARRPTPTCKPMRRVKSMQRRKAERMVKPMPVVKQTPTLRRTTLVTRMLMLKRERMAKRMLRCGQVPLEKPTPKCKQKLAARWMLKCSQTLRAT